MVEARSTFQSDVGQVHRVILKHARNAFVDSASIDRQWRALDYLQPPRLHEASRESDAFAELLERLGAEVVWMPPGDVGMDSLYVRDASVVCDRGAILCNMGKAARRAEPEPIGRLYGFPSWEPSRERAAWREVTSCGYPPASPPWGRGIARTLKGSPS